MKNIKKKICTCLTVAMIMTTYTTNANATSIKDLEAKRNKIGQDIKSTESKRAETRAQKEVNINVLNDINRNITLTEGRISSLTGEIAASLKKIEVKTQEIAVKQKEFDKRKAVLEERLVNIYKNGDTSYMEVLFQAENFSDFLTRFEYMSFVAQKDQVLLTEIADMRAALEYERQLLEQEKANYEALKNEQVVKRSNLASQQAEKKEVVAQLESVEKKINENLAAMSADSASIGAQIAEIQRQEAANAAAAAANGGVVASYSIGNVTPTAGGFVWPVPSSRMVTCPYGPRFSPIFGGAEFHMGVDIGAGMGSPVVSAKGGKIIMQTFHYSYGNLVVVDHGDGLSTAYAHLSGFAGAIGSTVSAGQVIGFIGTTGASTGPHLHFEVRINGQHTNPSAYIGG